MNTYQLKLDLNKGPTYSVGAAYSGITLRQGDKRGCTVVAELYDHGTRFTESGYTAYFVMGLPDREHYYREAATYNAGTATITINEALAASVAGDTIAYFELTRGDAIYSTQGIKVSVLKDARADKTPGETYDSRIEQAIQELEDVIASIDVSIEADVAEWLDQHPEATTTVQDGSITYAKLHSSTKQRLNNKLHRALTAPVVTASDAYAAPPVALVVDGKSVQDGTPTPDAPVAIASVESVSFGAAGINLVDGSNANWRAKGINGATGEYSNSSTRLASNDIAVASSTAYVISANDTAKFEVYEYDGGGVYIPHSARLRTGSYAFTTKATTHFVRVLAAHSDDSTCTLGDQSAFGLQLELGSTATPYQPYVGSTTAIPLQGHALRSLPDGTHDELRVDADGNVTLVQRVGHADISASRWVLTEDGRYRINGFTPLADMHGVYDNTYCTAYMSTAVTSATQPANTIRANSAGHQLFLGAGSTVADCTFDYPLATTVEISLGTVALPSMPAPDLTAWASCTPATELELDYERSVTIAVERLEAQIAEIATA